jgi:sarcosine oxidase
VETHDVIVVGLGAMGSAATYQLAARGIRVLGLDQFSPPHTLGSTHGDTRITRQAIGEGFAYVPLALRSHQLWREIEAQTSTDLLTTNGCLILGRAGTGFGFHGKANFLQDTIAAADAYAIPHEVLDVNQISERFPQFTLVGDEVGYFEPGAGFLRPEACVSAQLTLAARCGADIRRDVRVESFSASAGGVTVRTASGDHSAGKLIISAGPWIADFVGDELGSRFKIHRQVMHWFAAAPPHERLSPEHFPVYIWEVSDRDTFYGFPAVDGADGGMKVANEQFEVTTRPGSVSSAVPERESLALFDELIAPRFSQFRRRRVKAVSCLYTTTPDGDFVIDWHPESTDVLIASPCSGHGFKHSAAIGEVAAEMVTSGTSLIDVSAFSVHRFAGAAAS